MTSIFSFAGMNEPGQQNQSAAGQQQSVNAIMAYQQTFVDAVQCYRRKQMLHEC